MKPHGLAVDTEVSVAGGPPQPFRTRQFQWPLKLGRQQPYWQAGGPREGNTLGSCHPWPYMTGYKSFIAGFPYGVASSLVTNSGVGNNLGAGALVFLPIGVVKPQTYASVSF